VKSLQVPDTGRRCLAPEEAKEFSTTVGLRILSEALEIGQTIHIGDIQITVISIESICRGVSRAGLEGDQRWSAFLKNHAQAIVACEFFIAVTSAIRTLQVLVVIEHHSRRLIHCGVTAHPSAYWTRQQPRDAVVRIPRDREQAFHEMVNAKSTAT
jgi:hypothetical protein